MSINGIESVESKGNNHVKRMNKPETYSSGITIEQDTPMRALSQPRKQLFAGYNFSRVVMEDGEIWVWGANNVG